MKGRSGSVGIETPHHVPKHHGHIEHGTIRQSFFQRQLRSPRLTLAVLAFAIVLLIGVFSIDYGSKFYQKWRENRLLDRATTLLHEGELSKAAEIARQLLARHADSLRALAVMAETAEKQNMEEAVSWRERIAELIPTDAQSQFNLASAALRFEKLDRAREALDRVSPKDRDSAAFHIVAGWLARSEGNLAEQEAQFAAAVQKEPNNELYQFNLAALQIHSKEAQKKDTARDTLKQLSNTSTYRTGALRALLNDAVERNDLGAADNFAQPLQMSAEVTFSDYLLCLDFYRKLDAKKFRQLLDRVKPFAARNSSDLAALIEWMIQNGFAGDVVKWIDKLPAAELSSPPAAIGVAEAYATVKSWSRLKRFTQRGSWGDADYLRLAFEGIAVRHSRSGSGSSGNAEFEKLWQSAYELSEHEPERELALARLATKWQLESQAEVLWLAVEENPTMRREALENLRQLYRAQDETTKVYQVLQRLHESSPDEAPITADLARLGLNLGENTQRSHQLAKEAYDRAPNEVDCAVTYAFSLQRLGRNPEALAIIQSLSPDQLHDPHAAVYIALLLVEGNELDRAKDYIDAAENGKLYPEEKKLLGEAKTKLTAASAIPEDAESPLPSATPPR